MLGEAAAAAISLVLQPSLGFSPLEAWGEPRRRFGHRLAGRANWETGKEGCWPSLKNRRGAPQHCLEGPRCRAGDSADPPPSFHRDSAKAGQGARKTAAGPAIDYAELLQHFQRVQGKHLQGRHQRATRAGERRGAAAF